MQLLTRAWLAQLLVALFDIPYLRSSLRSSGDPGSSLYHDLLLVQIMYRDLECMFFYLDFDLFRRFFPQRVLRSGSTVSLFDFTFDHAQRSLLCCLNTGSC